MVAGTSAEEGEGRVATEADRAVLADYQALSDRERGTQSSRDWREWVQRGAVWVHERLLGSAGRSVCVRGSGFQPTPSDRDDA